MSLNTAGDHLCFDGLENITIFKREVNVVISTGTAETEDVVEAHVENCLKREIEGRQALESQRGESQGKVVVEDVFWELWTAELDEDFVPERGMFIRPDNNPTDIWEILAVDHSTLLARFRCHSRK